MTIKRLLTTFIVAAALMGAQASTAVATSDDWDWNDSSWVVAGDSWDAGSWSYDDSAGWTP
jgi:hypothetical protein